MRIAGSLGLWFALMTGALGGQEASSYDLVIEGGRVIDPATGYNAVANVGIRGGRIGEISREELRGERVLDASGQVVAPGFVDILAGGFTLEGNRYKVTDGVTTLLAMHGGPVDVADWYAAQEREGRFVHYGTTVGHGALREAVGITDRNRPASRAEIRRMEELAHRAILDGAVGIGFGIQYVPGASESEVLALFRVASRAQVPCHLHPRFLGPIPPENAEKGIHEIISAAAATGASAQIVHLPAMAGHTPETMRTALDLIEGARARGIDVMADAYPWRAGQTSLESAVFDQGWQERMNITYRDLIVTATGARLTESTFRRYRNDGSPTPVLIFHVKESSTDRAFESSAVMVGSDGGIRNGRGHPRGAGTYAKFLRTYVREKGTLELPTALKKITTLPASRLFGAAGAMRRKGTIVPGADADVVVFDPERVRERATYEEPARTSTGFRWVLVAGEVVVEEGQVVEGARPGRSIRSTP